MADSRKFTLDIGKPNKVADQWEVTVSVRLSINNKPPHPRPVQFYRNWVKYPDPDHDSPVDTRPDDGIAIITIPVAEGSHMIAARVTREDGEYEWRSQGVSVPVEKPKSLAEKAIEEAKLKQQLSELKKLASHQLELKLAELARGLEEIAEKGKTPQEKAAAAAHSRLEEARADAERGKLQGLTNLQLELAQADLTEKLAEVRTRQAEKDIALAEAKRQQETLAEPPPPQLQKVSALLNDDVSFIVTLLRTRKGKPEEGSVFYSDPDPREERTDQNSIARITLDLQPRARKAVFFLPENPAVFIEVDVPAKLIRPKPAEERREEPRPEPKLEETKISPFQKGRRVAREWLDKSRKEG